jgi:hypothetical protein
MARPVIKCGSLNRFPAARFEGRPTFGVVPPSLMAQIAAMQMKEARSLRSERGALEDIVF